MRGPAALTAAEPWLFPAEAVQLARQERRRYIQEASRAWVVSLGEWMWWLRAGPARNSRGQELGGG